MESTLHATGLPGAGIALWADLPNIPLPSPPLPQQTLPPSSSSPRQPPAPLPPPPTQHSWGFMTSERCRARSLFALLVVMWWCRIFSQSILFSLSLYLSINLFIYLSAFILLPFFVPKSSLRPLSNGVTASPQEAKTVGRIKLVYSVLSSLTSLPP